MFIQELIRLDRWAKLLRQRQPPPSRSTDAILRRTQQYCRQTLEVVLNGELDAIEIRRRRKKLTALSVEIWNLVSLERR